MSWHAALLSPPLCVVLAFACAPTQHEREVQPEAAVQDEPIDPDAEPDAPSVSEVSEPETPEPAAPESEPEVDSKIVTGFFVDANAQAGLIQFTQEMAQEGSLWVGQLEGNGGRDVLIYIPPGADDKKPFRLIYHFHGTYSEHIEKEREGLEKKKWVGWNRLEQTLAAATELQQKRDDNVALIYPFSAGKRIEPSHKGWHNAAYDRMWMDPAQPPDFRDSFDKLHGEVVTVLGDTLGVHPSKIRTPVLAEGHSAGGIALRNIAVVGTDLVGEYLYLDASFMGWADVAYEALKQRGSKALLTMVVTEKGIADPFVGRDPWCTLLEDHAAAWPGHQQWCEGRKAEDKPKGSKVECGELAADAELWVEYQQWCVDMKSDMLNVANVAVIRTKVFHGDQP
ncbi:MAG: hypothetical protein KC457_27715, partial [Myxococcales bacterium]|nr:hypothetical protein [Myxococcales bacterium]